MSLATISTVSVVALSAVLIASLKKQTFAFKIFTHPKVVYIGHISYSLYLWHWGVLSISRWTIGIHWWSVPFQVTLMLGLAIASYRYIETPLRKGHWFGSRWKTLLFGGGVLVTISGGLAALEKPFTKILHTGHYQFEKLMTRSRNFDKSDGEYNGKNCHFGNENFELSSSLVNCLLQSDKRQKTFFFAGNSHTDHHRTLHYKLHKEKGVGIFSTSISTCIFPVHKNQYKCAKNSQSIIENWILENIKKGDVVVISNRHISNYKKNKFPSDKYNWLLDKTSISAINKFSRIILSKGGKVVLFAPTPEYDLSIEECKTRWFRPFHPAKCTKTIEQVKEEKSKVYSLINNYLDKKILIYDPIPDMCFEGICSMTDKASKPLYVDTDHLSDYANSKYLFPGFLSFLEKHKLL